MEDALKELKAILAEADDLSKAEAVLAWDQETYMPPGGVEARAEQMATLSKLTHERRTSARLGQLLDALEGPAAALPFESDEASLVRVTRRQFENDRKLPVELVAEMSRAGALARPGWLEARATGDFSIFAPYLQKNVELSRQAAEAYGHSGRPYDALNDVMEPGITTTQLDEIFSQIRTAVVPLVRAIAERKDAVDARCLQGEFPEQTQMDLGLEVAQRFGYDLQRGRLDLTAHPFCTSFSPDDVRITTRVNPNFLSQSLYAIFHESGHAMYEQGVDKALIRTPLAGGTSAGVHESQSRLWENLVGRSLPFCEFFFPRLREVFPEQYANVTAEQFYRAVNQVEPSLIRVEADEVTYNLHILLRYELENALLENKIQVPDLPEAWNAKMQEYLGVTPPSPSDGVLQDIHWSWPWLAAFSGYTLGNVIGAQLFTAIRKDLPDLDAQFRAGEFAPLHTWLVEHVYRHGAKFTPNEVVERATGRPISTDDWIAYIRQKAADVYGVKVEEVARA